MQHNNYDMANNIHEHGPSDACIFIANLPKNLANDELAEKVRELLQEAGNIVSIKASRDKHDRPYAFVQFETVDDAGRACIIACGTMIQGRMLRVERAKCIKTLLIQMQNSPFDNGSFLRYASQYGQVHAGYWIDVGSWCSNSTGHQIACVEYEHRQMTCHAYQRMRAEHPEWVIHWVENEYAHNINMGITHVCKVNRKVFRPEGIRQIFVGNLNPDTITEGHLRTKFKRYGEILSIKLINRKHYNHVNVNAFAFINFQSSESASKAIEEENGKIWMDQKIKCSLSRY